MIIFAILILAIFILLLIKPLHKLFADSARATVLTGLTISGALAFVLGAYALLGHFSAEISFQNQQHLQTVYSALIDNAGKDPSDLPKLFAEVKSRLDKNPEESIGWYVYGQLAVGLEKTTIAADAFRHAAQQVPNNLDYLQALAQTLYQLSHEDKSAQVELIHTLDTILALDTENTSALHLKAGVAFENKDYFSALQLWRQLLTKTDNPKAKGLLGSLVGRAKEEINLAHPQKINVLLNTESGLLDDFPNNSAVFVAIKSPESPMPIWATKLALKQTPIDILLQASDAIAGQLQLPINANLQLTVLISKNNNPIKQKNDIYFTSDLRVTDSGADKKIVLNKRHIITALNKNLLSGKSTQHK